MEGLLNTDSDYDRYVIRLKREIDSHLDNYDHKRALECLVSALSIIEEKDLPKFIAYYENKLFICKKKDVTEEATYFL
jgi:hypothetical protein